MVQTRRLVSQFERYLKNFLVCIYFANRGIKKMIMLPLSIKLFLKQPLINKSISKVNNWRLMNSSSRRWSSTCRKRKNPDFKHRLPCGHIQSNAKDYERNPDSQSSQGLTPGFFLLTLKISRRPAGPKWNVWSLSALPEKGTSRL